MTAMGLGSAVGVGCGVCFGAVMKVHTAAGGGFSQGACPLCGCVYRALAQSFVVAL